MNLKNLINCLKTKEVIGEKDIEILDIKTDSNLVCKNDLFICLKGRDYNGHDFVRQAENYGAVAVVVEEKTDTFLTQIIVEDCRESMSLLAKEFYGRVDEKMKIIGVIGTNGKTSTSHFIWQILNGAGVKSGLIGTLGTFYLDKFIEPSLTTPDPLVLHKTLLEMYNCGIKVVVMEVSAHAISLKKICGITFEIGVFTNFSRDHLDFFVDMGSYKQAKLNFFINNKCKYVVVNGDDEVGREIAKLKENTIIYGVDTPSDVFAINLEHTTKSISYVINLFDCIYDVKLNFIGGFNVYNTLAAATATALFGLEPSKIVGQINKLQGVCGRLECVYDGAFDVYVDYAHTPDGLEKSINSVRQISKGQVVCVFGCGGNRDVGKRCEMGRISGEKADFTIVTSDNPRFEEPLDIMYEIENGLRRFTKKYILIQDRTEAIRYAINMAKPSDSILICGKGSENYQEILGIKHIYNDKDCVESIIGEMES